MKARFFAFLLPITLMGAVMGAEPGAETNSLGLVKDGQPACVIVVPATPSPVATLAAHELRDYVRQVSGAELPVKHETSLTPGERAGTLVLVGDGELARASGVRAGQLPPEGFRVKTVAHRLVLAGRDDPLGGENFQQGTSFAVSAFLENQLGVRWLWPGPLGEVVWPQPTIAVGPLDYSDAPRLRQRSIRDALFTARYDEARRRLGLEAEGWREMQDQSSAWLRRLRTGRSVNLNYQHGFTEWWEKYHDQHPEYFAKHLNGRREWPPRLGDYNRAKLCVSHPRVLDQFLANAREFFQQNPGCLSFSASPNDNAFSGHCLCEACKAWDATNAPTVQLLSVNAAGQRVAFDHPALTDRYLRFYNLAAERLEQIAPGKLLAGYAYGAWFTPPVRETVRSNVLIGFVGFNHLVDSDLYESRRAWDGWARLTTNLLLRPNLLHFGHGYPLNYTRWLGATLRHCFDTGLSCAYWDTLPHHWAAQGLNTYILAKLLWNPHADVDALIHDYCRAGFGPAAPAVRAYFDALEQHTQRLSAALPDRKAEFVTATLSLHAETNLALLQNHLDRAKELAAEDRAALARLAFLEKGLTYARLQTAAVRLVQSKDWSAARPAVMARQEFYRTNAFSFAVGVPALLTEENAKRGAFFVSERRSPILR